MTLNLPCHAMSCYFILCCFMSFLIILLLHSMCVCVEVMYQKRNGCNYESISSLLSNTRRYHLSFLFLFLILIFLLFFFFLLYFNFLFKCDTLFLQNYFRIFQNYLLACTSGARCCCLRPFRG